MSRSLIQANPPKKNGDSNLQLKQSRGKLFQGKMSNFTEVLIETNDNDVPYIAIYKPDIKKQQRRVQAITGMEKNIRKFELFRIQFAFNKLNWLKNKEQNISRNVQIFQQLFCKLQSKRMMQAFMQLSSNKMKKKSINMSAKLLNTFQIKIRMSNIKYCMNRLKIHNYQSLISTLSNQNQLSRELTQTKNESFDLKAGTFQQQFVEASKSFQKLTDHNTFIDHVREVNYQNTVKLECTRFEQSRLKMTPKKKDPFDNELVATALSNTIKAYEACIADHISYEQQLKQQLEGYTNTEGMTELNEIIRTKDAALSDLESFITELTRMDTQLKRFSGQKYNSQKILSLIAQQQKKLEVRSKKSQGMVPKLYNSRVFLDSLIANAISKSNDEKSSINQQLDQLIKVGQDDSTLRIFMKKIKDNVQMKSITNIFLNFNQKINEFSINLESSKSQNLNLAKQIQALKAQRQQNITTIQQITQQIESLKSLDEIYKQNIQYLLKFIDENQQSIKSHTQLDLLVKNQVSSQFLPIFEAVSSILKHISTLQIQKQGYLKQIEQLERRGSHSFSETKALQVPSSPRITKVDIRDSQLSLADRFMSPFKQMLENHHEDKELKHHIAIFSQKIEEMISQNHLLQEKLLSLQASDKIIEDLTYRITEFKQQNAKLKQQNNKLKQQNNKLKQQNNKLKQQNNKFKQNSKLKQQDNKLNQQNNKLKQQNNKLKQQNENLKRNIHNFNEIHILHQQNKERVLFLTEENSRLSYLANQVGEYEYRLRELSYVNAELNQQIASLRESNSQFSNIASTNLQLSEKINEIYNKSTSKIVFEGSEQQLIRQTELMQEILTLKIQSENTAIRHIQQMNSLKNEINSYLTIINKFEIDITHRESDCKQKDQIIQSLNVKSSELRQINIELKQKVQQFERVINVQTTNKFRDNEAELNILRQDCQNIYTELQRNIQQLRVRDNHIHSLQASLASQQEFIINLRKQNERSLLNIQDLISKNEDLQQQNSRSKSQLIQIKNQYHEIQMQYHRNQLSQTQISHSTVIYQKQIQDKQIIINNLLEQAKTLSASYTSQLQQIKQQYMSKERVLEERIADKDVRISKLEFELNEKLNTVMSLEQLISLYANSSSETTIKQQTEHFSYPYSRDKQIIYLRGQIKSLQEFLNDMANQYHELQKRYQQQRERTNRAYLNLSPASPQSLQAKEIKATIFSSEQNKQARLLDEISSQRISHSFMSNINMTFTESDIAKQLSRLMVSNQSLASSVDHLRGENKQLFMKVKSISSIDMVIELVFNILLTIAKLKSQSSEAEKIWQDLCHLRSVYSGEALFLNLEEYCRTFVVVASS